MTKASHIRVNDWTEDGPRDNGYCSEFWELKSLVLGRFLGSGATRSVYMNNLCAADAPSVIKVETSTTYQNINEWQLWMTIKDKPVSQYLAPCFHLSRCGIYLIQAKCDPLPAWVKKAKVPGFVRDARRCNFGLYRGKTVCLDYGAGATTRGDVGKVRTVTFE